MQGTWVQFLGQENPLAKGIGHPLQYSCLENYTQRSLVGYSLQGCKDLDMTKRLTILLGFFVCLFFYLQDLKGYGRYKIKYFFIPWSARKMDEGYPRAEAREGKRHMLHSCLPRLSCLFSDLFPILLWPHLPCHLPFRFHHLVGGNEERLKGEYFCLLCLGNASTMILPVAWLQLSLNSLTFAALTPTRQPSPQF